ncbi:MAG: putative amino terminal protease [Paenibacillaceae bacterium]|jgi:membrane protease YdiL (CAAX protease family)|nr:putative amino terminal protease [Paenibacillaceae bacterium]
MIEKREQSGILRFLGLAFLIAWGIEAVIIAGERLGILHPAFIYLFIGFGAGFAPAYAVYILYRTEHKTGCLKNFLRPALRSPNTKKTAWITALLMGSQLIVNMISEEYSGSPWYFFLLLIPVMVVGGGVEELGWRGFLHPRMEKRLPFAVSAFLVGIMWGCWHLPLWLVRTASQSDMNVWSFLLYCITFSYILGLLYRLTRSTAACILLHAWGNVLQGMFTRSALMEPPTVQMAVIWGTEIVLAIAAVFLVDHFRNRVYRSDLFTHRS